MKIRLLSIAAALLLMAPVAALAANHHSKGITLGDPAMVGNTQLKAGHYKVEWSGSGPQVEAKFLKDGKTVATAPAKLEQKTSPYDGAVDIKTAANNTKILQDIYWRHLTLKFGQTS
jgi:hypothetical protein